jgi:hypothetical protein
LQCLLAEVPAHQPQMRFDTGLMPMTVH